MTDRLPNDDVELFAMMRRELFSSVIGDVLDTQGLRHQYLPPNIRPLSDDMVLIGRAMPVLETDYFVDPALPGASGLAAKPFGLMFQALDDLKPNEIYVTSGVCGAYAQWGEMMTTRARVLGAAGAVLNGYARDTNGVRALNFPTFCHGSYGQDQGVRGKVVDYRIRVEIGQAAIEPGAILFGDVDGVVCIPKAAEAETLRLAFEKARGEKRVAKAIREGMSTVEAWEKFGIM
ncbi:MAG: RraA family protein [Rhizobiales bacterium]|nr:RraA family protein [Hyphomicrobiales bacterium]